MSSLESARKEIEAWYAALPPRLSIRMPDVLQDEGDLVRVVRWRYDLPEILAIDRIARKHGLEWAIRGSTTRPHILIYEDQSPLPTCFHDHDLDPLAHIRAEYQRLAHLDQVLEGLDGDDPLHLVARDLWRAVKADLEERS